MRILMIFAFVSILVSTESKNFIENLNKFTADIISRYFTNFGCVVYVVDVDNDEIQPTTSLPVILVSALEKENSRIKVLQESFNQNCGGFVVRVRSYRRLEVVRELMRARLKATASRYNIQKYVFLPHGDTDNSTDVLEEPDMFFMPNILIAVPTVRGEFALVTHTLFNHYKHSVLGMTQEVLDIWTPDGGFQNDEDLFPDKIKNVWGKKLMFGFLMYSPFALAITEGNKTIYDGFETRIAAMFVEKINGTWDGLDHPLELWGKYLPNGTSTGVIGSVMAHRVDLGYSAIYQWFCDDFDCSYPAYESIITCLVPKPRLVSGWLTIVLPFELDTWMALTFFFVFDCCFVLFVILSLRRIRGVDTNENLCTPVSDAIFIVFRLHLQQIPKTSKNNEALANFIRIFVFFSIFVTTFWQGGISSILTVPRYEAPINEISDLVQRWPEVEWGANSDAWIFSILDSPDPNIVEIVQKFAILDYESLVERAKSQDFGFFLEKLPHGHFGHSDYINDETIKYLRLMEGNVYTAFGVFLLPKGSPYSKAFDNLLIWMFDTGLLHKLEDQVFIDRITDKVQNKIRVSNKKEKSRVILAIRHIEGAIYIYLVGTAAGVLVFFLERFSHGKNLVSNHY